MHTKSTVESSLETELSLKPCKVFVILLSATFYDVNEVGCQNKRDAFSFHSEFALEVAENVPKVDVKHLQNTPTDRHTG